MLNHGVEKHLEGIDQARREVIGRLLSGSDFVAPVVVGFGMGHSTKAAFDLGVGVGPNPN